MPKPLPFRLPRALAAALLISLLGGCAALPLPTVDRPRGVTRTPEGLLDLRGVVHVHTNASHDSRGTIEELIDGAKHAGVVWVRSRSTRSRADPRARVRSRASW